MDTAWAINGVVLVLLIVAVKILVPKMMDAPTANIRFGIGVILFVIYTAVTILVAYHFCTFDVYGSDIVTGEAVFARVVLAFLAVNVNTVFVACLYHFTREKRKLSESDKMKLKDI